MVELNNEHLSQDLAKVKKQLLERKEILERALTELSEEKFADDQVQDPGDQAISSAMDSVRESIKESEHAEYDRIMKALAMIEEGTYGVCIDCGQPIKEKRLKYYPNATRCLICQERFESQS